MNGHEQIGLSFARGFDSVAQLDEFVCFSGQLDPIPPTLDEHLAELARHRQREHLLFGATRADRAGISSPMPRIENNQRPVS